MGDDKSEALILWKRFYGDADGVAASLTEICLTKLGDEYDYDKIGIKETIEAMMNIARVWRSDPKHTRDLEYGEPRRIFGFCDNHFQRSDAGS